MSTYTKAAAQMDRRTDHSCEILDVASGSNGLRLWNVLYIHVLESVKHSIKGTQFPHALLQVMLNLAELCMQCGSGFVSRRPIVFIMTSSADFFQIKAPVDSSFDKESGRA
jgi:hypothetical protein